MGNKIFILFSIYYLFSLADEPKLTQISHTLKAKRLECESRYSLETSFNYNSVKKIINSKEKIPIIYSRSGLTKNLFFLSFYKLIFKTQQYELDWLSTAGIKESEFQRKLAYIINQLTVVGKESYLMMLLNEALMDPTIVLDYYDYLKDYFNSHPAHAQAISIEVLQLDSVIPLYPPGKLSDN